jgi:large subunit ribosomal protein L5
LFFIREKKKIEKFMANINKSLQKSNSCIIKKAVSLKYYQQIICQDLVLKQSYSNIMELPSLNKIILNTTSSLFVQDKKYFLPALVALEFITGQKIKSTCAKKSIATFKLRQNQIIGCKITLRNQYMYNFLSKFILIIAPRVRDFSGVTTKNLVHNSSFTLGINNFMIFPELENHYELFETCKGLNITFGILTRKSNDALLLSSAFQIPTSI